MTRCCCCCWQFWRAVHASVVAIGSSSSTCTASTSFPSTKSGVADSPSWFAAVTSGSRKPAARVSWPDRERPTTRSAPQISRPVSFSAFDRQWFMQRPHTDKRLVFEFLGIIVILLIILHKTIFIVLSYTARIHMGPLSESRSAPGDRQLVGQAANLTFVRYGQPTWPIQPSIPPGSINEYGGVWLVGRRSVCGRRLSLRPIGCTPAICDLWSPVAGFVNIMIFSIFWYFRYFQKCICQEGRPVK